MGVISVTPGAVFQFIDANKGVLQYAGTEDAFNRIIKNELTISQSAFATVRPSATLIIDGTLENSGILKHEYLLVDAIAVPTSSFLTANQWEVSGSFIKITGNADHMALISNSSTFANHYVFNYMKISNNSNLITVRSTLGISGQTQWSSSDAYASIQVTGHSAEWIITSKVGNWY